MAKRYPGGYRKNDFDKQQDKGAVRLAVAIRAKHRAEIKAIDEAYEQAEVDKQLKEAAAKLEALQNKGKPHKKNRAA